MIRPPRVARRRRNAVRWGPLFQEHRLYTPLGDVLVTVSGAPRVGLEAFPVAVPALPAGMRVDGVNLLRIRFKQAVTPDKSVLLKVAVGRPGDASSGEWLESMAFGSPEGVLQAGLRDREWLAGEGIVASWASYEDDHVQQTVTVAPSNASMYVSIAWRSGSHADAEDVSTWLAVDLALPRIQKDLT